MKIAVLGATGGVGLEIIRQAVIEEYQVVALVRSAKVLESWRERITIRCGGLLDPSALAGAIRGVDVVLSAFGPRVPVAREDEHLLREYSAALVEAMRMAAVRRLVIVSSAFLFRDSMLPPTYLIGRLFFGRVVADHENMERIISSSGLDWTIVRPPQLNGKARTGRYRLQQGHLPRFGLHISRADVADCFLKVMRDPTTVRKVLGISD